MADQFEFIFGTEATLDLSYIVLEGNLGIFKNKGLPSGIVSKLWTSENFATACRLSQF